MSPVKAAPAKKGWVDLDRTDESLLRLSLDHSAERVGELLTEAVKSDTLAHWKIDCTWSSNY